MRLFRRAAEVDEPATGDNDDVPTVIRGRADGDVTGPYYELPRKAQVDLEVRARMLAALQMLPDDRSKADALDWTIRQSGIEFTPSVLEDA